MHCFKHTSFQLHSVTLTMHMVFAPSVTWLTNSNQSGFHLNMTYDLLNTTAVLITGVWKLLPPQGFGPETKARGGIIVISAYKYLQRENTVLTCQKKSRLG